MSEFHLSVDGTRPSTVVHRSAFIRATGCGAEDRQRGQTAAGGSSACRRCRQMAGRVFPGVAPVSDGGGPRWVREYALVTPILRIQDMMRGSVMLYFRDACQRETRPSKDTMAKQTFSAVTEHSMSSLTVDILHTWTPRGK